MYLQAHYDPSSSRISEKLIFSSEEYILTHDVIQECKKKGRLQYIKGDDLPEEILCQLLVQCDSWKEAKVILFNHEFVLPDIIHDEPLLNKQLIERSDRHGGLRIEFSMPLDDPDIKRDFSYEH